MNCDEKEALSSLYSEAIGALYRADLQLRTLREAADHQDFERMVNVREEGYRILDRVRHTLERHILEHGC